MQESPHSSDPNSTSGARLFIGRLLETFFRRWWLYVLPVVLLGALGLTSVMQRGPSYRSAGVIQVNRDSLLNELTSARGQSSFGVDSPATYTSRQFNTLLSTDAFVQSVITRAGLTTAVKSGEITPDTVRRSVFAAPHGDQLVLINAATSNPELSYRLAGATIDSYLQWQIDSSVGQSQTAEKFFESLLAPYQQRVDDAQGALSSYVSSHPAAGTDAQRPPDEQVQITTLTAAVTRATEQLSTARASLAAAELSNAQSSADVAQRLQIVDAPEQPFAPERHRRKDAITFVLFLALGGLISAAALVVATLLDRSVRNSEEIEAHLGVPVLASLPDSRRTIQTRVL